MTRWLLGCFGVALGLYGAWLLVSRGRAFVDVATWLVAGVLLHDLVLAPLMVAVGAIAVRLLPSWARGPAAAGLVVLGSVTLWAIPVLGRFGAGPNKPTLLDRDYWAGWLAIAGLTLLGVVVAAVAVRSRRG